MNVTLTSTKQSNRDILIDILKGYAIFLVVWGHSIQFFGEGLEVMNQTIGKYIYIFHMPLFFFMSSLVGIRSFTLPFGEMMKNKMKTLIIPLIIFSLLQYIICIINDYIGGDLLTGRYLIREFCYKMIGSYWFLIILMCYFITLNISNKIAHQNKILVLSIAIIFWLVSFAIPRPNIPFGLYITYYQTFMPFFLLGYVMKEWSLYELIKRSSRYLVLPFNFLLLFVISKSIKSDFVYFQNFSLWGGVLKTF